MQFNTRRITLIGSVACMTFLGLSCAPDQGTGPGPSLVQSANVGEIKTVFEQDASAAKSDPVPTATSAINEEPGLDQEELCWAFTEVPAEESASLKEAALSARLSLPACPTDTPKLGADKTALALGNPLVRDGAATPCALLYLDVMIWYSRATQSCFGVRALPNSNFIPAVNTCRRMSGLSTAYTAPAGYFRNFPDCTPAFL